MMHKVKVQKAYGHWEFLQPFNLQPLFQKSGSRKVVLQIQIFFFRLEKSGSANSDFFSGSRKVVDQKNRWVYTINPPFLDSVEPLFQNHFSTLFQKSGCRLNGPEDCLPWKVWITALCNDILYLPCFLGYKSCFAKMKELLVPSCCQGAAKCTQDNILQQARVQLSFLFYCIKRFSKELFLY